MTALAMLLPVVLAAGQAHDMHGMPGMAMPATTKPAAPPRQPRPKRPARPDKPAARTPEMPAAMDMPTASACPPEHAAMGHCTPPPPVAAEPPCPPDHAAMGHCTAPAPMTMTATGTDQPAGNAPAPPAPTTPAAARFYDPAAMARADRHMRAMHGGMRFHQVIFNLAEMQVRRGRDGYRWDGEGWFGGDIDRLVVKSEGEGTLGGDGTAEVQALYARAIDPYWNAQVGVRQDLGSGARRTYATVGVEGLAPYWFDVEGALFVSDRGDVLARGSAWYDQRITQRAILQPRIEVNLAARDMPSSRIGAGLTSTEIGVRLRYEIRREFAPYVGLSWERRYGATARYARADGDRAGGAALSLGVRVWF